MSLTLTPESATSLTLDTELEPLTGAVPYGTGLYGAGVYGGGGSVIQLTLAAAERAVSVDNIGATAAPDILGTAGGTGFSSASWSPPTSGLLGCFVIGHDEVALTPSTPSMSGNSLTWTQIGATYQLAVNDGGGLTLFLTDAVGASSGITTITFPETQDTCVASFWSATGIDLGNGVANTVVQQVTNREASGGTSGLISMAAPANTSNPQVACFVHYHAEPLISDGSWTELDDIQAVSYTYGVMSQAKVESFDQSVGASWATSDIEWGGMAIELRGLDSLTLTPEV